MPKVRIPANGWRPRPYQFPAWRYLAGGGRHCELVWHRRSGKDELSLHWTGVAMHRRVGNYWHMLPEAKQARKALWEAINPHTGRRRIDEVFPLELRASTNETEMLIRLAIGSTWQVVGSDNYQSLLGSPPVGLVFSEWALSAPESWAFLMPILEENQGWALFNTTPRGRNHAWRSLRSAMHRPEAFAQVLPVSETGVFGAKQLESIRAQLIETYGDEYGDSLFEQEYNVSFAAANLGAVLGRAIARAEREGRISAAVEYDSAGAPIEISSDIGFRDPAAWWFWQPTLGGFRLLDYVGESGLDAEQWIEKLKALLDERKYKLGRIWLPQDASARMFRSRFSALDMFGQAFGHRVVQVVPASTKQDQINAARVIAGRCEWHETRCEKGLDGLREWAYDYNEEFKEFSKDPRHDWASHPGDAFAYGAQVMRERVKVPTAEEQAIAERERYQRQLAAAIEHQWADKPKRAEVD